MTLDSTERRHLLDLCWQVIGAGLDGIHPEHRRRDDGRPTPGSGALLETRASFVTLTHEGRLRGCCGSVVAHRPLVDDVADNAWRTAFADPRFPPLARAEVGGLKLEVSVLSEMTPVAAESAEDLLRSLRPDRHGLMIAAGGRRATFLPKVWSSLPEPNVFLDQLRQKAGMNPRRWPEDMQAWIYTTECFGEPRGKWDSTDLGPEGVQAGDSTDDRSAD